jgi:LysR family glycine cleavage system transcriptional activator
MRELPPIASLRAFAHAARTLSFKRAASELHVSASALSRQIQVTSRSILGAPLFRRLNPGLELTDDGRGYLAAVDAALAQARGGAGSPGPTRPLRVSALESFSESWLVPNSRTSRRRIPDVTIELEATLRYADFARDAVDVAIRFGTGRGRACTASRSSISTSSPCAARRSPRASRRCDGPPTSRTTR